MTNTRIGQYRSGEFCAAIGCEHDATRRLGDKRYCVWCKAYELHEYLKDRGAIREEGSDRPEWKKASEEQPEGTQDHWSAAVVTVSDRGTLNRLAYYRGDSGGVWQRPGDRLYLPGEKVMWWSYYPSVIGESLKEHRMQARRDKEE